MKWVYKVKLSPRGEVTRHKAILVAQGFLQKEGIDFDEVGCWSSKHEQLADVSDGCEMCIP